MYKMISCNMPSCNSTCNTCCNALLPFFSISNLEFKILNTNYSSETNVRDDEYFSPKQISNIMSKQNNSSLMIHFNTWSSAKNKNLIKEFITEIKYSPEVIGISETKINSKTCLSLNIPGFVFFIMTLPLTQEELEYISIKI